MTTPSDGLQELDHRATDGLAVTLFWRRATNQLLVSVVDAKTGEEFSVPAAAANALDVFRHPFAYVAAQPA